MPLFGRRRAIDVSLGGIRLYADEAPKVGEHLELELFVPEGTEIACTVEVVWVEPLAEGAPAYFDVGMKFVSIDDEDRKRLAAVLVAE